MFKNSGGRDAVEETQVECHLYCYSAVGILGELQKEAATAATPTTAAGCAAATAGTRRSDGQ